ncbi:uncharacterized protein LOC62_05G007399 [Vanrija pseudolonga]|uniref:Uncharacterized protein n=1 Tax=Vanrija pseudolonga TaxID=143232 RepID=A0AAF1BP48_9TREE|nr:hypothetical protein LOC62_05G007399 [Vanrija pseudolonga]
MPASAVPSPPERTPPASSLVPSDNNSSPFTYACTHASSSPRAASDAATAPTTPHNAARTAPAPPSASNSASPATSTSDPGYDADVSNTSAETALSGFTAEDRSAAPVGPGVVLLPASATPDPLDTASVEVHFSEEEEEGNTTEGETSDGSFDDAGDADDEDSDFSPGAGDSSNESYSSEDGESDPDANTDTDTPDSEAGEVDEPDDHDKHDERRDRHDDQDDTSTEDTASDATSVSSATRAEVARLLSTRRPLVRPASPPEVWAARQHPPRAPAPAPVRIIPRTQLRINADGRATPGRVVDLFSPLTPAPPSPGKAQQNEVALVVYVLERARTPAPRAERRAARIMWTEYLLRSYGVDGTHNGTQLAVIQGITRRAAGMLIARGTLVLGSRYPTAEAWAVAMAQELHEFAQEKDSDSNTPRGRCDSRSPAPSPPPPPPGRDVSDLVRAIGCTAERVITNGGAITSDDEPNPESSWTARGKALRAAARRPSPAPSSGSWRAAKDEAFAYRAAEPGHERVERAESEPLPGVSPPTKRPRDDVDEDYDTPVARFHPAARPPAHERKRPKSTRVLANRRLVSETAYELGLHESIGMQVRAALDAMRTERDVAKVLDWAPGAIAAIDRENAALRRHLGDTVSVALDTSYMPHLVVQTLAGEHRVWADNLLENLRIRARVVQAHQAAQLRYSALDEATAFLRLRE